MTANEVDRALAAPPADVGPALLAVPEDQWFERKSSQVAPKDLAIPLIALANAEGGVLVVGLSDGVVQGTRGNSKKLSDFRQVPMDFTSPPVRAKYDQVHCKNSHGQNDSLLVIRVDPSERVHELKNGDSYLRVGDESRKLNFLLRQELEFDKGQSQYDGFAALGVNLDRLDSALIENYRERTGAKGSTQKLLAARSLLTLKGEVTNAGYLLFGEHPQDLFPQAFIRVVRFLSTERGTGARLELEDSSDIRIEGPIPRAIQEASRVIDGMIPRRRALSSATGTFESMPILPRDAWLEGVVNAAIHRSYSLSGDHIRVEIYPNRIEIESPGRFPGLSDPSAPLEISRFARNPRIARVCADLHIGQELGEGIKRIFDEMRLVGLTDPTYQQGQGSVRLILRSVPRLDIPTAARLPNGSQRVLDLMRGAGRDLSTGDITEALGLSRPTALTRLKALEEEDLIRWVGKSTRDPRAVWVLTE